MDSIFERVPYIQLCDFERASGLYCEDLASEHCAADGTAVKIWIAEDFYDADDNSVTAKIARWIRENTSMENGFVMFGIEY